MKRRSRKALKRRTMSLQDPPVTKSVVESQSIPRPIPPGTLPKTTPYDPDNPPKDIA